jgi:UTP-glucose-1-phosphate uridylyltransferase
MRIERIVEKPKADVAPSRMGVAGRYILTPGIFKRNPQPAARRGRRNPADRWHRAA